MPRLGIPRVVPFLECHGDPFLPFITNHMSACRFRVEGCRVFRGLGFRGLGFRDLGARGFGSWRKSMVWKTCYIGIQQGLPNKPLNPEPAS